MSTAPDLAADDARNHKKTKQTMASVDDSCIPLRQSSLQTLPLELLESIFLYSKTLALPRSSPLLGAKLSGKTTLLRLFIVGFHDTWDQLFGITLNDYFDTYKSWSSTCRLEGDFSLQSDLLSMPWVDIDFILEAQQTWADKYAGSRCYRHYTTFKGPAIKAMYEKKVHVRDRYIEHIRQHEEKTWKFDARACFEADYERALQIPPTPQFFLDCCLRSSPDVHPDVYPPVHLLTGPWDEEKKRRLFWLIRAGADLRSGFRKSGWEVRLACLDATVIFAKEPDPLIINCLIGNWIFHGNPKDAQHKRLVDVCRRIDRGGDTQDMREILREVVRSMDHHDQFIDHYFSDDEW
ncbi:hypothetical protein E4U19_003829 [Claviceps sp. Clav32 group G5]|nr:hypothetical protein E4U19_003829 [Claviceps sp. Clav32 group G5]